MRIPRPGPGPHAVILLRPLHGRLHGRAEAVPLSAGPMDRAGPRQPHPSRPPGRGSRPGHPGFSERRAGRSRKAGRDGDPERIGSATAGSGPPYIGLPYIGPPDMTRPPRGHRGRAPGPAA